VIRFQTHNFKGKTAIIFGASRGIGRATADVLADYGAHVILCARSETDIHDAALEIMRQGGNAEALTCDVTDFATVQSVIDQTVLNQGQIDIVVNCAGVIEPLSFLAESDPEIWSRAVDVNLKGTYFGMRAVLPHMITRGEGSIVNISSGAANSALVGWSHYCATKAGAAKLTTIAQKEVAETGVRIVGLSPGTVATDMMAKIRDSNINAVSNLDWSKHIPPDWAGEAVAYLCGPGGADFAGMDFSIKTADGRARIGLPQEGAPDA